MFFFNLFYHLSTLVLILDNQVAYDSSGFLEKNRDLLHMDSIQLLAKCKSSLPQMFASKILAQSDISISVPYRSSAAVSQKLSVAMKFKVQIFVLTRVSSLLGLE